LYLLPTEQDDDCYRRYSYYFLISLQHFHGKIWITRKVVNIWRREQRIARWTRLKSDTNLKSKKMEDRAAIGKE